MEMQMEMSYVFAVVITGLVVVFLGLVLLIAFISIIGKIFEAISKSKKPAETVKTPAPKAASPISAQTAQSTEGDEVIAVISAAVAMMSAADGTAYRVKSIRPAGNSRSRNAWAAAGLRESTTPF